MIIEDINAKSQKIVKRCETRDPFKIAKELGIQVIFTNDFNELKGLYRVIKRVRYIIINANIPYRVQRIVCAHEIGHDQLHREFATHTALQEFVLYKMDSRPEYEANIFAACLLLPDDEVLQYMKDGYDAQQIACLMHTDINLMALKVSHLIECGYKLRPMDHNTKFLK